MISSISGSRVVYSVVLEWPEVPEQAGTDERGSADDRCQSFAALAAVIVSWWLKAACHAQSPGLRQTF
ncbi:hypothetical protein VTN96DRAFT_7713 [Rasamsonia emersonii]